MDNTTAQKKVLLAVRPVNREAVSNILESEFDLAICHTLGHAIECLDETIGLIVCGVRFDAGSMFELLSAAKAHPHTKQVPYYLVLGEDINYSPAIWEGICKAAEVRGVSGFIDLSRMVKDLGRQQCYERVRQGIRAILDGGDPGNMPGYFSNEVGSINSAKSTPVKSR